MEAGSPCSRISFCLDPTPALLMPLRHEGVSGGRGRHRTRSTQCTRTEGLFYICWLHTLLHLGKGLYVCACSHLKICSTALGRPRRSLSCKSSAECFYLNYHQLCNRRDRKAGSFTSHTVNHQGGRWKVCVLLEQWPLQSPTDTQLPG